MQSENYQCHICWQTADKPVVTPCGHLFCWPCIYQWLRSNQQYLSCPTCKSGLQISMLRPILVPGELPQKTQNGIPPRPKPVRKHNLYKKIIKNGQQEETYLPKSIKKISMNMYRGVLLAGYGLFPSCYSMAWQKNQKILPNQQHVSSNLEYKFSLALEFWVFVATIIMLLFMIYI